jgi:hypothetical protein
MITQLQKNLKTTLVIICNTNNMYFTSTGTIYHTFLTSMVTLLTFIIYTRSLFRPAKTRQLYPQKDKTNKRNSA